MDKAIKEAVLKLLDDEALYETVLRFPSTLIDPPEYMDYCKLCAAPEREHEPTCLFFPLWWELL